MRHDHRASENLDGNAVAFMQLLEHDLAGPLAAGVPASRERKLSQCPGCDHHSGSFSRQVLSSIVGTHL
jgi:hypothetical protein